MWRWLLATFILIQIQPSFGAPTSSGPVSDQESEILWTESKNAIKEARFQDAANSLQRIVDRYPGKSFYLESHFLLGKSWMELGSFKAAIAPLKSFIERRSSNVDSIPARLLLSEAFLKEKKYNEAYLGTLEIDQLAKKMTLSSDFLLETLLVKTQALMGLKKESRALSALESAEKQLSDKNSPTIKGKTYSLKLDLKIKDCEQFPSQGPLDEGQMSDQLERRGTCLLEAFLIYQNVLKTGDLRSGERSTQELQEAVQKYALRCSNPPPPPVLKDHPRTRLELERYRAELSDLLIKNCKKKMLIGADLLQSWKPSFPSNVSGLSQKVSQSLENFTLRKP